MEQKRVSRNPRSRLYVPGAKDKERENDVPSTAEWKTDEGMSEGTFTDLVRGEKDGSVIRAKD